MKVFVNSILIDRNKNNISFVCSVLDDSGKLLYNLTTRANATFEGELMVVIRDAERHLLQVVEDGHNEVFW